MAFPLDILFSFLLFGYNHHVHIVCEPVTIIYSLSIPYHVSKEMEHQEKFKFIFQQRTVNRMTGTPSILLVVGGSQRKFSRALKTSNRTRSWTISRH